MEELDHERSFVMTAGLYERLREYAHRSGERTLEDAVASLLDAAAGTAPAASCSEGSATAAGAVSAAGPGAGKRRRTDPPQSASSQQETETAAAGEPEAEPALIDQLPDDILSVIFERLSLQAAAAARAVCRRWRDVVDAIVWRRLNVKLCLERVDELAGLLLGAQGLDWSQLDDAAREEVVWWLAGRGQAGDTRVGGQRIRVAPGASLRLQLEVTAATDEDDSEVWQSTLFLLTAFSAAAGAASGGGGGLGEVDVDCSCAPGDCFADLLGALVPRDAAICPSLRSLALRGLESCDPDSDYSIRLGVDPESEFCSLPLVLPNLETLSLFIRCSSSGRPAAEALARCLPNLKRLEFFADVRKEKALAIGEAAAAFSSLEYILAYPPLDQHFENTAPLLEGLASGPAALSLKELELFCPDPQFSPLKISARDLRALTRFPALLRLSSECLAPCSGMGEADLAALGSFPALKSVGLLALSEEEALITHLNGLTAALERPSSLTDLKLCIRTAPLREALPALARLAGAARGRLSLELEVDLAPGRPAEVAAAVAAAPPRSLTLVVDLYKIDTLKAAVAALDGLSAFAGCSAGSIEVRLEYYGDREGVWGAVREAVARALPTARLVD
eukprot:tig00020927_g15972.t1